MPRQATRRAAFGALAAATLARPAIAQGALRRIRFSLPWVAQGSALFVQVAQQRGHWRSRGLDVDVARGFGSVAVSQALAAGQFDFALVQSPFIVLANARGLPITALAFTSYSAGWAFAVRTDGPVRTRADLAGRRIGGTPTAGDFPFLPVALRRAGVNPAGVSVVQLDNKILEQSLIAREVDAISSVISSSGPVFISQNVPVRFLPHRDLGVEASGLALATRRETLERDPELCRLVTEGLLEALAYSLTNPRESLETFYRAVPELGLTASGRRFAEIGLAMQALAVHDTVPQREGLGAESPERVAATIDIVLSVLAPEGARRPAPAEVFDPRFARGPVLTSAQWEEALRIAAPYAPYFEPAGT